MNMLNTNDDVSVLGATPLFMADLSSIDDELYIRPVAANATSSLTTSLLPPQHDLLHIQHQQEVVFIESNVADYQQLIRGLGPNVEVHVLDANQDGLQQMADILAGRSGIDAVHILSHASEGKLNLGTLQLDSNDLAAHAQELQSISHSLKPGGDILLYGCNLAAGTDGAALVDQLATVTGADIAASNDLTGAAQLGGDWTLEVQHGQINTPSIIKPQLAALYNHVLDVTNVTVSFENYSNFVNTGGDINASYNVVYKAAGNANYQLVLDGALQGTLAVQNGNTYVLAAPLGGSNETSVLMEFKNKNKFTPSSIQFASNNSSPTQTLVFRGYDASNHQIGSTVSSTYVASGGSPVTVNFTDLADISYLKVTATTNGGDIRPLNLDNLIFSSIKALASPPTTTVLSAALSSDTGSSSTDFITNTASQTISSTLSAALVSGEYVEVSFDGGTNWNAATSYTTGSSTWSTTTTLSDSGTFQARVSNTDGSSTAYSHTYQLDTTAPTTTIATLALSADTGSSAADFITNTASQTISGTLSANLASGEHVQVSLDNGTTWVDASATVGQNTFSLSGQTLTGSNTLKVRVVDTAGNAGTVASQAYVLDTTAPTTTIATLALSADTGSSSTDFITNTASQTISGTLSTNLASGEQVQVSLDNGTTWLDASATVGQNTFSLSGQTLSDSGTLKVRVVDTAGNAGTVASQAYVLDTSAPTAPGVPAMAAASDSGSSNTDHITNHTTPAFTGTAEANSTVTLYDTDGTTLLGTATADGSGNWSITSATLSEGTHTLTAKATDAAGNVSVASSGLAVTIDTSVPTAPAVPAMAAASDSGSSNTDHITNHTTPTFTGTAEANSTVTLYDTDGTTLLGTATADGSGNWSITSATLSEGAHTLTAKATDAAGNVSVASSDLAVTIDSTTPTTTIATLALSADTGSSSTDFITNTASQTISGTLSVNLASGEQVQVSLDNGTTWVDASATVGQNTFSLADQTLSDSGTLKVRVVDTAGNAGTAMSQAYVLDATAPTAPSVPAMAAASDSGSSNTDHITNHTTPTFTGTAEANSTVTLYDTDGTTLLGTATADGSGNWSITSATLSEGEHTLTAKATDAAGNVSVASSDLAVTIDSTAPTTTIATLALSADTGSSAADFITNTAAQTISGTLSANLASGEHVQVSLDNGTTWADASATVGQNTFSLAGQTLSDSDTLKVRVVDTAGNTGTAMSQAYVLDTTAPTAPSVPAMAAASDSGSSNTDHITNHTTPTFTGTAEANSTVTLYDSDGTTLLGTATADGSGNWSITSATLSEGAHTLTAKATDAAGNVSVASSDLAVTIDTTVPTTTIATLAFSADTGSSATDFITNTAAQTISGTLSANLASGEHVQVSLDNGTTWADASATVGQNTFSLAGQTLSDSDTLKVRVVDTAGNAGTVASQAYVLDTAAPTLNTALSQPADNANGVTAGGDLVIKFSESLSSASDLSKIYLKDVATGTLVAAVVSLSGSGDLVINPNANLDYNKAYYVTWDAGVLKDTAGNSVSAVTDNATLNFTTQLDPSPSTPPVIDDGDGVSNTVENDVPSLPSANGSTPIPGDGNGDGISDSQQANVSSAAFLLTTTAVSNPAGAQPVYVTLVADSTEGKADPTGATSLLDVKQLDAPKNIPADLSLPLGLISFEAEVATAGATKSFSLYVDDSVPVNGYWKLNKAGEWVNLASSEYGGQVVTEGNKSRLDFKLVDGGEFDSDGKANGVISDPGGIGFLQSSSNHPADTDHDQFPDQLEAANGLTVGVKDNDVFHSNKFFVMELYRDFLFREAEPAGLAYWQGLLDNGTLSREKIASLFLESQEFQSAAGGIARLYFGALDRLPDNEGMSYWMDQWHAGQNLSQITASFEAGNEFQTRYAGLVDSQFISKLYQDVLGRTADSPGVQYWTSQLSQGHSRSDILLQFTNSSEYVAKQDAAVSVALDYVGLLGRTPESAGFEYWLGQLQQVVPEVQVIGSFLSTQEYHDRFLP